ncbi:MAG: hypothetical protein KDC14_08785 [Planctomycetes bacterium]|nr:hypothetical protein [Planctomycetota bacterium]
MRSSALRSALLLVVLFAALFTTATPLTALPQAQEKAGVQVPRTADGRLDVDLGHAIDHSIRWLRAQQLKDGSYGGSVTDTAWVLRAMAESPRHYLRGDGPFVRDALDFLASRQDAKTGAIYDPQTEEAVRVEQSVLALLALELYSDADSRAVYERLAGSFQVLPKTASKPLTREQAEELVLVLWPKHEENGSWPDSGQGSLVATASAVIDFSRALPALKVDGPKVPRTVTKLPEFSAADREQTLDALRRGALYLLAVSENGRWGPPGEPEAGLTAMVLGGLLALPEPRPEHVQWAIDSGLAWLVSLQDEDGSIHDGKMKNYITSAAVLALVRSGREEYQPVIAKARDYLIALQADEGEGYSEGDRYYGGIGYGSAERPDLSNLQFALEALDAAGVESGDAAFQRALKFLERTQNRSESNDTEIKSDEGTIKSGDDGGASYAPGDSKAGFDTLPDGTLVPRSYGSMTYALLKGYLFAGLPKDDPRMQAAWKWVTTNYTLDVNPGFEKADDPDAAYQGLFYYFLTMAKAFDLYGQEVVVDGEGVEHAWRAELCGRLIAMQSKADGSWVNHNSPRWWEGNPTLATAYAMLTLGTATPAEGTR